MHILTRRVNEGVVIGESLHVTVLEVNEDHVRLAFSCPDSTPSYWEEILYVEGSTADELELAEQMQLR